MRSIILYTIVLSVFFNTKSYAQKVNGASTHLLEFKSIPDTWESGIPLGNGMIGALIWQRDGHLRIAIDRADLWDLRPVKEFQGPNYNFQFIVDQVRKKDLKPVYEMIDARTSRDPAPSKIPAGSLEFDIRSLGAVKHVQLDLYTAVCKIFWESGVTASFYVNATDHSTHYRFENLKEEIVPTLFTPSYQLTDGTSKLSTNKRLSSLGYPQGDVKGLDRRRVVYTQQGWGDLSYQIALSWTPLQKNKLEGRYLVSSKGTWYSETTDILKELQKIEKSGYEKELKPHKSWWRSFWAKSELNIPDKEIEKQWYLEQYKFGAASRKNSPPISLQAIWTADNGEIPPWRGDFHSDLNTQLSYWSGYGANHMEESSVFTDWLWQIKDNSEKFTKDFFQVPGLNVSCIATLTGQPIGGWNQYSHSPSASGWLAHHFYLQWKYSMDPVFLRERAYPWIKEVARFFEHIAVKGSDGKNRLPISSSPEINDNRLDAWFNETTNYDLASIILTYTAAIEMATHLGLKAEADYWKQQLAQWPKEAIGETGLLIAPDYPMTISHRHFSHLLSFHPFGLIDVSHGDHERKIIEQSIANLEKLGTDYWVGYSFSWMANLKARVFNGDDAAKYLRIFIRNFCSPNSFHLNGDQKKEGYSKFTYKPFTLEGNFAAASAIQELLMQSHTGTIRVFPALPKSWENASFSKFRAFGAFLVSAQYENGTVTRMSIYSEKGGELKFINPKTNKLERRMTKAGDTISVV